MILARQPDPDADRKEQAEIREYGIAGRRHRRPAEQIGLTQTQQQSGDGQNGDRQHQCPPELLQSSHAQIDHGLPQVSMVCAANARTSAADVRSRQRIASSRQASIRSDRIPRLTAGTMAGPTEAPRTPSPSNRGTANRSAATPPQTATILPAAAPALAAAAMSLSTAGCKASARPASSAWPRSIARVYCVRSLLPMERKSAARMRLDANSAAAGVSIIAPSSMRLGLRSSAMRPQP